MAENLHAQHKSLNFCLAHKMFKKFDVQINGNSKRSNLDYFFLNEYGEEKIVSEQKFGNHMWSVTGKLLNCDRPGKIYVYMVLYVHIQPVLEAEESATLKVTYPHSDESCFEIRASAIPCSKYGPYEIKMTLLEVPGILDFGKLTLTLGTEKVGDPNCVSLTEKQPRPDSMDSFLEYSNELFQNHELSDVTLKIRGQEFPAHKLLLSSSSPVFKTMFHNDFRESGSNVVEIQDFEFEVIHEMLKFIYTHKPPQFRSPDGNIDIISLYKASHKYAIKCLQESCREELLSTLNIESALDVLLLADIYDDVLLKEKVLDFICKNPPAVDDASKCEDAVRQRPGLLIDILTCKFKQN